MTDNTSIGKSYSSNHARATTRREGNSWTISMGQLANTANFRIDTSHHIIYWDTGFVVLPPDGDAGDRDLAKDIVADTLDVNVEFNKTKQTLRRSSTPVINISPVKKAQANYHEADDDEKMKMTFITDAAPGFVFGLNQFQHSDRDRAALLDALVDSNLYHGL